MTAQTPEEAPSPTYTRWAALPPFTVDGEGSARLWADLFPEEREFWRSLDAAQESQPAPELSRLRAALARIVATTRLDADLARSIASAALDGTASDTGLPPGTPGYVAPATTESRYRQALERIAGYAAGTATKRQIGDTARRALEDQ